MKKINITINGTIGVGKTTLIDALARRIKKETPNLVLQPEPSVTVPFINDVLQKFYNDNTSWSYPLQLLITAAQEAYMQELRESDYDYALMDMAYSSDIYSYSHQKHHRMRMEDHYSLLTSGRPFKFDYLIWLNDNKQTIIDRIKHRNNQIENNQLIPTKKDISIEDFSYLDLHMKDFEEYFPIYIEKFKRINPNIEIIKIEHVPEINTEEYNNLIENIYGEISKESKK